MTAESPRLALLVKGSMVSRYRLGKPLGRGGHGVVFEAFDTQDAVQVAIKLMEVELSNPGSRAALDRFAMEVNAIRRVRHPNVVQVYESGHLKSQSHVLAFYTMEILGGGALDKRVHEQGAMAPQEALAVVRQAAAGLHRAHVENVIHRDVKPANIFLTLQGRAVVMDFGVCKLNDLSTGVTLVGQVVGTPRYLAPEQLLDGTVDARTDVFALGAVLFYLLTGTHLRPKPDLRTAFQAVTSNADVQRVRDSAGIPDALKDVLTTALCVRPEQRFESARAMGEALEATQLLLHHDAPAPAAPAVAPVAEVEAVAAPADTTARDLSLRTNSLMAGEAGSGPAVAPADAVPVVSSGQLFGKALSVSGVRGPGRSATSAPVVLFCPLCGMRLVPDQDLDQHLAQCPANAQAAEVAGPNAPAGRDWDLGTPGGLLGAVGALCLDCGAELENSTELARHAPMCPQQKDARIPVGAPAGEAWLSEASAVSSSLPALVGTRLLDDPLQPPQVQAPVEDGSLELDLSGSGSKARNWTGRDARGTGAAVNLHVSSLYTAANRIKDTGVQRNVASALDLMAPVSALVHDHVLDAALFTQCLQALMRCGSRLLEAALFHDSILGIPRRQLAARLEARLQQLTSGKVFEDRELQKVVRAQLDVARTQERQMAEAAATLGAGLGALRQIQPQALDAIEGAPRRPRKENEAVAVAMVKQLHGAMFGD